MGTSGWAAVTVAIPSGAAISPTNLIRRTPQCFNTSIAAAADPPVASMGSRIRHTWTVGSTGSLL